ncbi:hypothetical protein Aduo_018343 [Ancylostoma duodenale]
MVLNRVFFQRFRLRQINYIVLIIFCYICSINGQSPCDGLFSWIFPEFFYSFTTLKFAGLIRIIGVTQLNVTRTKQYLTTPSYGQANYPPKMNCYYELVAEPGNRISIEILDVDMEAQIFRSCLDYIGFYEGNQARYSRPYLSFCGQLKERQVTSQGASLTIRFYSDELIEARGVKISYEAVAFGQCDAGWLSREDGNCYRYVEAQPKVGWADAQEQCSQMQSNLASIRDQRDFDYMSTSRHFHRIDRLLSQQNYCRPTPRENSQKCISFPGTFGHTPAHAWVGYTDADEEGNIMGVDSTSNTIWPEPPLFGNGDVRDCLYLDYSHSGPEVYRMADCRTKQTFICQKHNNWSTVAVESQRDRIRRGAKASDPDFTIWLLILVAVILFVILLCILFQGTQLHRCYCKCWNYKK